MTTECPFGCGWTTDDPMSVFEVDAVESGNDRLCLHLVVQHNATVEAERDAWDDGTWAIALFPRHFSWDDEAT